MTDQPLEVPGLVHTLRILRERWWLILACAIACTTAAVVMSAMATKKYTATSNLLFHKSDLEAQVGASGQSLDSDPEATKATNVLLVTTGEVAKASRSTASGP